MSKLKQIHQSPLTRMVDTIASGSVRALGIAKIKPAILLIGLRRFSNEYKLPLYMTTIFIVSIAGLAGIRYFEKSSLVSLLPSISSGGKDYSTLLITDKTDEFQRGSTDFTAPEDADQSNGATPAGTSTSFTLNDGTPSSGAGQDSGSSGGSGSSGSGSGGSSGGSGGSGGGDPSPDPTPKPFAAAIAFFKNSDKSYDCPTLKLNKGQCSAVYTFSSGVSTRNGPGTVEYSWLSSVQAGNANGSYVADSGDSITPLQRQVSLRCNQPQEFSMKFIINSPTTVQSATIGTTHHCDDL